jgi:NAD(P)-dependent dehydrogenase (short-subunit alcohol dehydrogenase family)
MNFNLSGKVALVTGGLNGIGKEIARAMSEQGVVVYVADIHHSKQIANFNIDPLIHYVQLDVSHALDFQKVVDGVLSSHGQLDILVNCAGILKTKSVLESSLEDWDQISKVNLSSIYYGIKAVMPSMIAKRYGKIINLASVSSVKGGGALGNVLYGTTKAGVVAFSQGFARELGKYGINVNAISPGVVDGTFMVRDIMSKEIREKITNSFPMGRLPKITDISNLALFLSSDVSSSITGQNLVIDCGFLVK